MAAQDHVLARSPGHCLSLM